MNETPASEPGKGDGQRLADAQSYAGAMLNILEDAASERVQLEATQKAILNILEDAAEDRGHQSDTQRAVLNILDDLNVENKKADRANAQLRDEIAERARSEAALRLARAAAEKANLELDAFSYSVAHDLRAPLRSIDGFSQALLEDYADKLDEQGKTYLGYVRESAQHMAQLIEDLLSLSRVSRTAFSIASLDLAVMARAVIRKLRRSEPDRIVEFVVPEEMTIEGDARLLGIALENLLGNAWKFTRKSAHARIELGQQQQLDGPVYFIRDNGAGFDMAHADKLFAVFQRLHTTQEFEGTGIGLVTVQRIVHRHDGRVWAKGEVGRGATFYFTLKEAHEHQDHPAG